MTAYYGSELADHAVHAYHLWCGRTGYQYDEPGPCGVDITMTDDGREIIKISGRMDTIQARYVEQKNGRLRRIR